MDVVLYSTEKPSSDFAKKAPPLLDIVTDIVISPVGYISASMGHGLKNTGSPRRTSLTSRNLSHTSRGLLNMCVCM